LVHDRTKNRGKTPGNHGFVTFCGARGARSATVNPSAQLLLPQPLASRRKIATTDAMNEGTTDGAQVGRAQ